MLKYGLSKIRRLEQVDAIELKPITLLVGRNSGGKSSFLRTLPLLRQSLMTRTSSPILWYGDLVDFGTFDTAVSRQVEEKVISFSFEIDDITTDPRPFYVDEYGEYKRLSATRTNLKGIKVNISIERRGDRTAISNISIDITDPKVSFSLTTEENNNFVKMEIDGEDVSNLIAPVRIRLSSGTIFPDISFWRPRDDTSSPPWALQGGSSITPTLTRALRRLIDYRTKDKTISELASRLAFAGIATPEKFKLIARNQGATASSILHQMANSPEIDIFNNIYKIINIINAPSIFRSISQHLINIFSSTLYIGPARVRSDRYYRYQDLAVSEIDPDGKNFPMFLNSLSKRQIDEFSAWVKHLFGYGVSISRSTGHISINLTEGKAETNIVDVGYGVSQILPVLGQIWWANNRPPTRNSRPPISILAIEQPELHLHPAHQALLADALIGEVQSPSRRPDNEMRYVVETHSETLINRLGEFITAGRLSPADVQVVLFEAQDGSSTTNVRTVGFDNDGGLIDWPYGFFQPEAF